jgi:hypothetical protein
MLSALALWLVAAWVLFEGIISRVHRAYLWI